MLIDFGAARLALQINRSDPIDCTTPVFGAEVSLRVSGVNPVQDAAPEEIPENNQAAGAGAE